MLFDMTIYILNIFLTKWVISVILKMSDNWGIQDILDILDIFNMRSYAQILCLFFKLTIIEGSSHPGPDVLYTSHKVKLAWVVLHRACDAFKKIVIKSS